MTETVNLIDLALIGVAIEVYGMTGRVEPEVVRDRVRENVSCLRALRRAWLPMWALREDNLGRTLRMVARSMTGDAPSYGRSYRSW